MEETRAGVTDKTIIHVTQKNAHYEQHISISYIGH